MAANIRSVQIAIAIVNVLIFALVFTSIWPFPSGDFKLDLPSAEDVEWSYSNGVVYVSAPYSIDNGGFYDVEDLVLSYDVTNYTNAEIHSDVVDLGTIPAGSVTSDELEFTFPLLDMYESGLTGMVFNDDLLEFVVEVSCYYTMRLIHFRAEYTASVPWDAIIESVGVDGGGVENGQLAIDYHLSTSDIMDGAGTLRAVLYNGTTVLAEDIDTVSLGTYHDGRLAFDLPLAMVPDRIVLTASVGGFEVTETCPFDPGWLE